VFISVTDNGKGIPADILPKLGNAGETYGKPHGTGLGLHHAKLCLQQWDGSISITSVEGQGTKVLLTLPRLTEPAWFVPKIVCPSNSFIVILDDDTSIHQIWQSRFEPLTHGTKLEIVHFSTESDFCSWVDNTNASSRSKLFLVDYELLKNEKNGLALIEELQIQSQSILVTSRYEETEILERCKKLRIRLIPKGMAWFVPITLIEEYLVTESISPDSEITQ
jgi:hypothetical protein